MFLIGLMSGSIITTSLFWLSDETDTLVKENNKEEGSTVMAKAGSGMAGGWNEMI